MIRISILISFLFSQFLISQNSLSGKIIDAETNDLLPYVNIGVVGKNIGTVSDLKGNFKLDIPESLNDEALRISIIGYKTLEMTVNNFRDLAVSESNFALDPEAYAIEEIVISSKERKSKILGNKTRSTNFILGFASNILGNELATKIKIKRNPTYLNEFYVSIAENKLGKIRFRVNFYNIKNGLPHLPINKQNIIVETDIETGVLTVDLRPYNIVVKDDFYISLEWIEDFGDVKDLYFSAGMLGKAAAVRHTSHGHWTKIGTFSVGYSTLVEF